ncbi:DLW-39 family protein [Ornithinicoccus halotolerans]|nr:DLW-39 family protein [Ornithinicoccus halotolerans]
MNRVLGIVVVALGAAALAKKWQDQQAERDLWAEATDTVPNAPQPPAHG